MPTNPLLLIPAKFRLLAYLLYGIGSLVVTYLVATHKIGADVAAYWTGLGTFLGLTAASHTPGTPLGAQKGQRGAVDLLYGLLVILVVIVILLIFGVIHVR